MGCALVALLLVVDLGPEGMPDRFGGPLHARLSKELWTLEAPVHPGLLPAAFGDRCNARIFLQCGGRGIASPLFAKGDEEAGGEDRASAWEGLEEGAVGMGLGPLRDGGVELGDGLQGDAELGDKGLDQQGMGGDNALIGGSGVALLMAWMRCPSVRRAHMVVAEEGLQGGAAGELRGCEGGPAAQKVTKDVGIFVLKPLQHVREIVFQGTGQAVGHPDFVADHATAVFDELRQGAHGGALRGERR